MRTLPTGLLLSAALLTMALPMASGAETTSAEAAAVQFGMDANAVAAQKAAGVSPDYGTFWIGPWTLSSGWGGPDAQMASLKSAGVTPAIHFYYWGDDISPSCVENGCWSSLHDTQKTRAGWETLGTQLTSHLNSKMGGEPVVIFLESEFNKGGISTYEPFDGYMAAMADKIHAGYPNAIVVLGFGNWDSGNWYRFDQAAAASDMVGLQGMRGSTKDSATVYNGIYEGTLTGVQKLDTLFGQPIMLTDIALSSYPEPSYLGMQADNLKQVFDNLDTLKANGVEAMIYRSWKDSPNMDLANYYGEAERHWGLAWADGDVKEAGHVWVAGVKAERAGTTPTTSTTTTTTAASTTTTAATTTTSSGFTATVTPSSSSNEWWVQVGVSPAPAKVEVKVGSGSFVALEKQSYGYSKSVHAEKGAMVQFRVTSTGGQAATTPAQAWLVDMSAKTATATGGSATTTTTAAPTTTTASTTTSAPAATVTVTPSGNEWWVQVGAKSAKAISKVEAKVGSGSYVALDKESYGYSKSLHIVKGTQVQFRVTASDGTVATTAPQAWLVDMSAKSATFGVASSTSTTTAATTTTTAVKSTTTTSAASFKATFTPKSKTNNWWVEVGVSANQPLAKVEAKVGSGAYVMLEKTDYGTYAKSLNAPDGSKVTFRATSTAGATYTSVAYTWG